MVRRGDGTPLSVEKPAAPEKKYVKGDEEWKDFGRRNRLYKDSAARARADRLSFGRLLSVADVYSEFERFYMVHRIDFRSRCYPACSVMQYQGRDQDRGLLEFSDGKPIGTRAALSWFLIHGSNLWGNDKVPLADRELWVQENQQMILEIAVDPYGCRDWDGSRQALAVS